MKIASPAPPIRHTLHLPTEQATQDLGQFLAEQLQAGDVLLLTGAIGAGKSHLSRALIRARLGFMVDVPSPTFTLVQTYEADVEIWHADLYRLSHPDEVIELGLDEAFSQAICLIEWPDRLGDLAPASAISLSLTPEGDGRRAEFAFTGRDDFAAALAQWDQKNG